MNVEELRELARMGQAKLNEHLFTVRPISNGFVVHYDDVEEYQAKVPVYDVPAAPRMIPHGPPKMETRTKHRVVRKEVFCADAAAIKAEVDRALGLVDRVKLLRAEDVLLGEEPTLMPVA